MKAMALLIAESCSLWLTFILVGPAQWKRFTEIENAFWVRTGLVSEKFAARCKKAEQGYFFKALLCLVAMMGVVAIQIHLTSD